MAVNFSAPAVVILFHPILSYFNFLRFAAILAAPRFPILLFPLLHKSVPKSATSKFFSLWEIEMIARSPTLLSSKFSLVRPVRLFAMANPPVSRMEFPDRSSEVNFGNHAQMIFTPSSSIPQLSKNKMSAY